MNKRTQNIASVCAVALIMLLIFLQKCGKDRLPPTPEKQIIEKVIADTVALNRYRDSTDRVLQAQSAKIELYKAETSQLRAKLNGARVRVREAIPPTPDGFINPECDSLAVAAAELSGYSEQLENQIDSLGNTYEAQVQTLTNIVNRQDSSINLLRAATFDLNGIVEGQKRDYAKLARNNRWQKAKGKAAAGVALVAIGKIVFDIIKK